MVILLLLLAHLIADFWLQTDSMVRNKSKSFKKHMLHHLLTTGLALTFIWGYTYEFSEVINHLVFPLVFICLTHFVIDLGKIKLVDSIKPKENHSLKRLGFFLLDQLLHMMILLITCILFFNVKTNTIMSELLELLGDNDGIIMLGVGNTLLFIIIIFILATSVSGHIIKLLVGSLPSELTNFEGEFTFKNKITEEKYRNSPNAESDFTEEYQYLVYSNPQLSRGRLIGYIERLLVISLTVVGAYPSIAFIIAAKSIARFKQLDDRNWAEYFLLGTLASIFIGLMLGLLVRAIVM